MIGRSLRAAGPLVIAACSATLLLGWWSKARCVLDGGWEDQEAFTRWCYSDIVPLWFKERLVDGAVPYLDHPVEYPVLTGAQMYVGQQVVDRFTGGEAVGFLHVTSVMNFLLALGVVLLLAWAGLPRHRQLWYALAPALGIYAFLNWDPLAVFFMTAAVVLHIRDRDGLAGIAAGLGVAAKLTPGVVIPFILFARLRQGRVRDAFTHAGAAAVTWLVVNVPVVVFAREGWLEFWQFNRERGANFDSIWYFAAQLRGSDFATSTLNSGSAAALLALSAVVVAVGMRNRPPAQYWSLALPVLCLFVLTNKVYSPQYTVWLLPLAALGLRRLAPYVALVVTDLFVFMVEFPWLATFAGVEGPPLWLFAVAFFARTAALVWVVVAAVSEPPAPLTPIEPDTSETVSQEAEPAAVS